MEEVAMRKSRFSESQIVSILKEAENGRQVKTSAESMALAQPAFTSGSQSMAVLKHLTSSGSESLKMRTIG